MSQVQRINRLFLLACAPLIGAIFCLLTMHTDVTLPAFSRPFSNAAAGVNGIPAAVEAAASFDKAHANAGQTKSVIQKFYQVYEQSTAITGEVLKIAAASAARPVAIYDQHVTAKLGTPSGTASSGNIDVKLFNLDGSSYNGYALKVNLKSDKGMKMVLGKDKFGAAETTLAAANRYGAVAGVNAGGFADDNRGKRYPLDTTVMGGKYVNGFFPSHDQVAFIGMSANRKLIGDKFSRQADLDKLNPAFGATFVPVLLKNGEKQSIPSQWQSSPARAARTVIGSYKHDQLLFIVTDGADQSGNSGATLAELQDKMQSLGIKDAYNLDGGGSTSLIFNGQVINRPSDGQLRPLPTHFLFFR